MAKKKKVLHRNPTPGEIQLYAIDADNKSKLIISITTTLIIWGVIAFVFYRMTHCIEALIGERTFADIKIDARLSISIIMAKSVPWLFGIAGVIYGLLQRSLKRRNIMKNHEHIKKLETKINKKRKSSRLTVKGETRKEDKI
jgi:hypothetical protein